MCEREERLLYPREENDSRCKEQSRMDDLETWIYMILDVTSIEDSEIDVFFIALPS